MTTQLDRASIPASSAVRGARCSSTTDSWLACAPSPTAPIPSSVGMPRAEVKLPSDAPPVDASSRSNAKFSCQRASLREQLGRAASALHRRPVDSACNGKCAALVCRFERSKPALDPWTVSNLRDTHVHLGEGFGGNHVGLAAAARHAYAYRQAALQLRPAAHRIDDTRDNSRSALAPFSKSTPACAATPRMSMRQFPVPFRAVL